ncbi:MAG: FtsX-like permease family protein [Flavobacteriales bacterium]
MSTESFIARRFNHYVSKGKSISRPITRIATYGIALGTTVMLLSISIVIGFQEEIRNKVIGFGAHVQVTSIGDQFTLESQPIVVNQDFYSEISQMNGVKNIQMYAIKAGILRPVLNDANKDINRDLQGVIVKGIGADYDRSFFEGKMKAGKLFTVIPGKINDSVIVSGRIADLLHLELHQKVKIYFVKDSGPKERNLIISGIYDTGLNDFDKQFIFADIGQIRSVNNWGVKASLQVNEICNKNSLLLTADAFGGSGNYSFNFTGSMSLVSSTYTVCPTKDTLIRVIAYDNEAENEYGEMMSGDTASVLISGVNGCPCETWKSFTSEQLNDSMRIFKSEKDSFYVTYRPGKGTAESFTGGFEINLKKFSGLEELEEEIYQKIPPNLTTKIITDQYPEIFGWLKMLDMNVYVIIILMVLVGLVNMTSALLVIILERTSTIGLLKAIGYTDWSIRKIFVFQGVYIVFKGLVMGNLIAIAIIVLQKNFHVFTLPPETYNLHEVPMSVEWMYFLLLNAGTLLICSLSLLLPSYLITRISPIKSIRFE